MSNLLRKLFVVILNLMLFASNFSVVYADEVVPSAGTISSDTTWTSGTLTGDVNILDNVTLTIKGQVTINGNVTITGSTNSIITRDSSYTKKVFSIPNGNNLTIKNIEIDGKASYGVDTGMPNYSSTLLRQTDNIGTVASESFIYVLGKVVLEDVEISNCGSTSYGAAINVNPNGYLDAKNVLFKNNSSKNYGGAIIANSNYTMDSKIVLDNCEFVGNNVTNSTGVGGAIAILGKEDAIIKNCNFHNNLAGKGGAIYTKTSTYITSSKFENNEALEEGGGIYSLGCLVSIKDDSLFKDNISPDDKEAIVAQNGLILEDSAIYGGVCAFGKITVNNCVRDPISTFNGYTFEQAAAIDRIIEVNSADDLINKVNDTTLSEIIGYFSQLGYISNDPFIYTLTNDLDFSGIIATESYIGSLTDCIDGQGYKMINLNKPLTLMFNGNIYGRSYYNDFENYETGNYINIYPTFIKNVKFENCTINDYGLISNEVNYVSIADCEFNNINVTNSNGIALIASNSYAIFDNIKVNNTSISGNRNVGGLVINAFREQLYTNLFNNCEINCDIEVGSGNVGGILATNKWNDYNVDLPENGLKTYIYNCVSNANINVNCDDAYNSNIGGFTGYQQLSSKINNSKFTGSINLNGTPGINVNIGGLNGGNDEGVFCFGSGVIYENCEVTGSLPESDWNVFVGTLVGNNYSFDTPFTGTNEELHEQFGYIRGLKFVDCEGDYTIDNSVKWLAVDKSSNINKLTVNGTVTYLVGTDLQKGTVMADNNAFTPIEINKIKADIITIGVPNMWWPVGYGPLTVLYAGIYTEDIDTGSIILKSGSYASGYVCYLRGGHVIKGQEQIAKPCDEELREFLNVNKDGFIFMGFYDNPSLTGSVIEKPYEGNKYYAKWHCLDHSDFINANKEIVGTHHCPNCDFEFTVAIEGSDVCDHVWGEEIIDLSPSCNHEGSAHKDCNNCDSKLRYNLSTIAHTPLEPVIIGDYKYTYCDVCGELIKTEKIIQPEPSPTPTPHYVIPKTGIQ